MNIKFELFFSVSKLLHKAFVCVWTTTITTMLLMLTC